MANIRLLDRRALLLFFTLLFFAITMRLVNLSDGLWLDEIWSMIMSAPDKSVIDIINACKTDTHPPLFDLILHVFLNLVGDDPINGRILSLIFGFLGIFATFFYTLRIANSYSGAIIAFGLVSLSYFHIYYSAEGRFYTFIYLLSLVVLSHLYLYFTEKKNKHLIIFTVTAILLVYTHYYGIILLLALGIAILFLYIKKLIDTPSFLYTLASGVLVLVAFSPWLPFMFSGQEKESWMQVPHLGNFFEYLYNYTGKNPLEFLFVIVGLLLSIRMWKSNKILYTLLYSSIVLGFLIPFLISYFKLPMLHFRYTIIYFPSIILIVAMSWDESKFVKIRIKQVIYMVVALSILINFFFINDYTKGTHKEPWNEIAAAISKQNHSAQNPVYTELGFYLNYYLKQYDHPDALDINEVQEGDSFFYLITPYDESGFVTDGYELIESKDYGKGFVLYRYKELGN